MHQCGIKQSAAHIVQYNIRQYCISYKGAKEIGVVPGKSGREYAADEVNFRNSNQYCSATSSFLEIFRTQIVSTRHTENMHVNMLWEEES